MPTVRAKVWIIYAHKVSAAVCYTIDDNYFYSVFIEKTKLPES
jgi:hypothetical protein